MADSYFKAIDARRAIICEQMLNFSNKLVEWSGSQKNEAARFATLVSTLNNNNKKLLTKIVGIFVSPVADKIDNQDDSFFTDPRYQNLLTKEICGESSENFDFSSVFKNLEDDHWTDDVHDEFWKRVKYLLKVYLSLVQIDQDMKLYKL